MDDSKTYNYKVLEITGDYKSPTNIRLTTINISDCNFSFIKPFFDEIHFLENFRSKFDSIVIPQNIVSLLEQFLISHKLEGLRDEFILILSAIQEEYIFRYKDPFDIKDSLAVDFQNMNLDLDKLLDALYNYLQNANDVKSISIKFQKTFKVKNTFLIRDIMNSIVEKYGLTLENFDSRKKEILDNYQTFKLALFAEKFKSEIIKGFLNFIRRNNANSEISNQDLIFPGSILHLAQVTINAKSNEIVLTDLNNIVSNSDVNNLRHYINRSNRFSL